MAIDGYVRPADAWPHAELNVERALAIDPDLPDAHAEAASSAFFYRWDRKEADRHWKTALASRKGEVQSELLGAYALQQWASGQLESALQSARAGREVDPLSGQAAVREADLLAALGRHEEAVALYSQIIRRLPSDSRARFGLSEVQRKQRRFEEAIRSRKEAHAAVGDHTLDALFAKVAGAKGLEDITRASAGLQLDRLIAREEAGEYVSPLEFGRTFAQLGDTSRAFTSLDAAFEERAAGLVFLGMDPAWDNIRGDTRFSATVRRVGID
jgi:tetratricopeptide (TPR) repeat protein